MPDPHARTPARAEGVMEHELAMIRLRAEIVRLSHEIDGLADLKGIRFVRGRAPQLAERLRQIVMRPEYVASARPALPLAEAPDA